MTHGVKAAMNSICCAPNSNATPRSCRLAVQTLKMPLPRAHHVTGRNRRQGFETGVPLHQLSRRMQAIEPKIRRRPWTCFRWKRREKRQKLWRNRAKNVLAQAKAWLKRLKRAKIGEPLISLHFMIVQALIAQFDCQVSPDRAILYVPPHWWDLS